VGTQQRYAPQYLELVQRIRDGQIGELTHLEALWIGDMELWHYHDRQPSWSDMEWQVRCWPLFTWLSGDHYVEQLVHNLDVVNWVAGATPVVCQGLGGRQVRTGPQFGNIFDHFAVRYEYANGMTMFAMATQQRGISTRVGNVIHGTKGSRPRGPRDGQHHRGEAVGVRRGRARAATWRCTPRSSAASARASRSTRASGWPRRR
jgi:myo-inositol 2-dehydrogenase / D-chiro-inositol 1-dehydrogenase